ncbi:lipopolysaccharide export system protein LptC [Sphingomonas jinjuensis]|uniref:Lipopolysaccharide export system protein LptC n=1 Tax=Sphingomonas jinjuensis TaxID=535907 RepID=A0A840FFM4_9SPHN|nr:LPS export ABC transporter periplasmic protein LptC [Sphingomonas jinjuensis]MBB4155701.1 lipopolysaccharide export system protein LptC [Sphingomonas jinjuensis]
MSDAAVRMQSARARWAEPGSRHDRIIAIARVGLPISIGVLAAFLVMAPLTSSGDVSFVLDKNKVEIAKERMRSEAARYRGQDGKGQAFLLEAGSAVQKSSAEPIVQLQTLAASLELPDGPATIRANTGRYDMDSEQVKIDGPVAVRAANGYSLDTRDAIVDLKDRKLASDSPTTGTLPQGTFRGDRLRADLAERTVTLEGNARLRVVPQRTR